jgi:hypothetical protein
MRVFLVAEEASFHGRRKKLSDILVFISIFRDWRGDVFDSAKKAYHHALYKRAWQSGSMDS